MTQHQTISVSQMKQIEQRDFHLQNQLYDQIQQQNEKAGRQIATDGMCYSKTNAQSCTEYANKCEWMNRAFLFGYVDLSSHCVMKQSWFYDLIHEIKGLSSSIEIPMPILYPYGDGCDYEMYKPFMFTLHQIKKELYVEMIRLCTVPEIPIPMLRNIIYDIPILFPQLKQFCEESNSIITNDIAGNLITYILFCNILKDYKNIDVSKAKSFVSMYIICEMPLKAKLDFLHDLVSRNIHIPLTKTDTSVISLANLFSNMYLSSTVQYVLQKAGHIMGDHKDFIIKPWDSYNHADYTQNIQQWLNECNQPLHLFHRTEPMINMNVEENEQKALELKLKFKEENRRKLEMDMETEERYFMKIADDQTKRQRSRDEMKKLQEEMKQQQFDERIRQMNQNVHNMEIQAQFAILNERRDKLYKNRQERLEGMQQKLANGNNLNHETNANDSNVPDVSQNHEIPSTAIFQINHSTKKTNSNLMKPRKIKQPSAGDDKTTAKSTQSKPTTFQIKVSTKKAKPVTSSRWI